MKGFIMKEKIIIQLLGMLIKLVTGERLKKLADVILDFIEKEVEESKNTYDDAVILPLCRTIRDTFDIIDND